MEEDQGKSQLEKHDEPPSAPHKNYSVSLKKARAKIHGKKDRRRSKGGVLLLLEETRFQRKFYFTMGFLPGFDHFEDYGLRPSHPLLSAAQWSAALRAAGFAEVAALTPAGSAAEVMEWTS